MRPHKSFTLIAQEFKCDKNCPYCTAKTTLWPLAKSNQWDKLESRIQAFRQHGVTFEYATLSGNGEPSLLPMADLKYIFQALHANRDIFPFVRCQTSGNGFYNQEYQDLLGPEDVYEITRVSFDPDVDMRTLRYARDYTKTESFRKSPLVLNIVLMKGVDPIKEMERYSAAWPNLREINLVVLNLNTLTGDAGNKYSQWILRESVREDGVPDVVRRMSETYRLIQDYDDYQDTMVWRGPNGVDVNIYFRKAKYGAANVVFYQGRLIDYHMRDWFPVPHEAPLTVTESKGT